jgi:hypothetical protein
VLPIVRAALLILLQKAFYIPSIRVALNAINLSPEKTKRILFTIIEMRCQQ